MSILDRLSTGNFLPHGHCLLWEPWILWLHVAGDAVTTAAYYSIPLGLVYLAHRRPDLIPKHLLWMFGAFIFACGTTHLISIYTMWVPAYTLQGIVKGITASLSIATAVIVVRLLPQALKIPSAESLQRTNNELKTQIAKRERAEKQLREKEKMEVAGQMAAGLAHDFNNLLSVIVGVTSLLKERQDLPAETREQIEMVDTNGQRMANTVRQFLDFSRRTVATRRVVSLGDAVEAAMPGILEALPEAASVSLEITDKQLDVRTNDEQLRHLLRSLVNNAAESAGDGGQVSVRLDADGDHAVLTVEDNGTGIPADVLTRIYEPFFTTKSPTHHNGLGLAQAHGIVSQHGGQITAGNRPGGGALFTVRLPLVPHAAPQPAANGSSHHAALALEKT